jgi:peroxidase
LIASVVVSLMVLGAANISSANAATSTRSSLKIGFYATSCPTAESLIQKATQTKWNVDKTITAGILRMFFHDCFVQGCDASNLIVSTPTNKAELDALPNLTLHGMDLIETAKAAVEEACPGIVSCADIIALATRDVVVIAGGSTYEVPTGRRDSRVSLESSVNIPGPSMSVASAAAAFQGRGLTLQDMVTLLGAHTVGVAHCEFFFHRLYNYSGTGQQDPNMAPSLASSLKSVCGPQLNGLGNTVALDQGTEFVFDTSYYQQLKQNHGVMQIDQELTEDPTTSALVTSFSGQSTHFDSRFAQAIVKMGNIGVLTGSQGEIRRICSKIN